MRTPLYLALFAVFALGCDSSPLSPSNGAHHVPGPIVQENGSACYSGADVGPCGLGHATETRLVHYRTGEGQYRRDRAIDARELCILNPGPWFEVKAVTRCAMGKEAAGWFEFGGDE